MPVGIRRWNAFGTQGPEVRILFPRPIILFKSQPYGLMCGKMEQALSGFAPFLLQKLERNPSALICARGWSARFCASSTSAASARMSRAPADVDWLTPFVLVPHLAPFRHGTTCSGPILKAAPMLPVAKVCAQKLCHVEASTSRCPTARCGLR